ncbi:CHAT domain-containing protein [Thermodesulfobacteriota bacterium]
MASGSPGDTGRPNLQVRLGLRGLCLVIAIVLFPIPVFPGADYLPLLKDFTTNPNSSQDRHHVVLAQQDESRKRYRWLFREPTSQTQDSPPDTAGDSSILNKLDFEIKLARKLYLSGESENAILKYRSAIDHFESVLNDVPATHPLLGQLEERLQVFDELCSKILGPVQMEPRPELAGRLFHLMEKRRICRRRLILKKAGVLRFLDVPAGLLDQEAQILAQLLELRKQFQKGSVREKEEQLKGKLANVRRSLLKSSSRYARFRSAQPRSLGDVRRSLLAKDEIIIDFNLYRDRVVVGLISREKAEYHQFPSNREDIGKAVFSVQEELTRFTLGDRHSFMGHAWKEPCRRIYRALFARLPALPEGKTTVFIIPDRALWYLPFSIILDPEDAPFGRDRLVSIIPSVEALGFLRTQVARSAAPARQRGLMLFESLPWISEEELPTKTTGKASAKKSAKQITEGERIERLILTNPVYPRPSKVVVEIQKAFKKFGVWVGAAATIDRMKEEEGHPGDAAVFAVPLAVPDRVGEDNQPSFFFSPDSRGQRRFVSGRFFETPMQSALLMCPMAWFNLTGKDSTQGEGPILLLTSLFYSGIPLVLVNYSNPDSEDEAPFMIDILRDIAAGSDPGRALAGYARKLPTGLDSSFSGKPPPWAGWITAGDPRSRSTGDTGPAESSPVR